MTTLSKELFEGLKCKEFKVAFDDEQVSICEIIEVKDINSQTLEQGQSQPFSLLFQTHDLNIHEQGTYSVKNEELEEFALFLVPVFGDQEVIQYEAVFT